MDSHIITNIRLEPSEYRFKDVRIYRVNIVRGVLWGFIYDGYVYLSDTLDTIYRSIDVLNGAVISDYILKELQRTKVPLIGFQKTCDEYTEENP